MAMTLITTNTSSNAATSDFTSSIDSTYKLYIFKFIDVNPATDNTYFGWQANASGQSGYNEVITSTGFAAYHAEDDSGTPNIAYRGDSDLAQGTGLQYASSSIGNGSDESLTGEMFLFNPSNTTYVKHFYSRTSSYFEDDKAWDHFNAGYINVTAAITNIQFKMTSGNIDAVIKMYGVG